MKNKVTKNRNYVFFFVFFYLAYLRSHKIDHDHIKKLKTSYELNNLEKRKTVRSVFYR